MSRLLLRRLGVGLVAAAALLAGHPAPASAHHDHGQSHEESSAGTTSTGTEHGTAAPAAPLLGADALWRRPSRPRVTVLTTRAAVSANRVVSVAVTCSATRQRCAGKRSLLVPGGTTARVQYRLAKESRKTWRFTLPASAYTKLVQQRTLDVQVRVRELKPSTMAARTSVIRLRALAPAPARPTTPTTPTTPVDPTPEPGVSEAYANRNWVPTADDTCPASLHRKYSVVGPDGKLYPTWHPATVVNPDTGQTCTFGHEHGDDPRTSDIYDWVADYFGDPDFADQEGLPFGYVSERLTEYAGANAGTVTRHEDNVGHKVIVANDVKLVAANPRGYVRFTDADGVSQIVTCDYLMKVHQGTHSADATSNNAHELFYAMKCNDGSALITATMTRFGNPNEFNRGCEPGTVVQTQGSNLPQGQGGSRLIPDRTCLNRYVLVDPTSASAHTDVWGIYEVWRSVNSLTTAQGKTIASFDPWFGVRNPSRFYDGPDGATNKIGYSVDAAWSTDPSDNGVVNADPWMWLKSLTPFGPRDPRSPFSGAQRDFYLAQSSVDNTDGPTTWYSDPYGQHALTVPFTGSVAQYVAHADTTAYPTLERRIFGQDADYGSGGVHAPN